MARTRAKATRTIKPKAKPKAKPTADPAAHPELVALFREWDRVCEVWAHAESGTPEDERLHAELRRLSRVARSRLHAELPAGTRLMIDPETNWSVWHNGSAETYNFAVDRKAIQR